MEISGSTDILRERDFDDHYIWGIHEVLGLIPFESHVGRQLLQVVFSIT